MANTGYVWSDWGAMQKGSADWTADALGDTLTETGDDTSLDGKGGCEVSIALVAGAGTIDVDGVTIHVLGNIDDTNFEDTTNSGAWAFNITPVESNTVYKRFSISPQAYGDFKLAVENQSGQSITVTVKYRTASFPVAS